MKASIEDADEWIPDTKEQTAAELYSDDRSTWTGLYDDKGREIHRMPIKMGFHIE